MLLISHWGRTVPIQANKLVGLYLYRLKCSELNYTVAEKDAYAILKSLKYFDTILFGENVTSYSDNMNILNYGDITKRLNRWKLLLTEYNAKLVHKSTKDNIAADYLSRLNAVTYLNDNENPISIYLSEDCVIQKDEKIRFQDPGEEE